MTVNLYHGDCRQVLGRLDAESVQCVVTSPPYWGICELGELGAEPTKEEHVAALVDVFRAVRRVLRPDGVLWLNYGDSYNHYAGNHGPGTSKKWRRRSEQLQKFVKGSGLRDKTLKPKDMLGLPWRVALALQADGWYLRSDVVWSKACPQPMSHTDRPRLAHEYVFLLTKSERYRYEKECSSFRDVEALVDNVTTVWEIGNRERCDDHPADFPPELAARCIELGSRVGDIVLDPFGGAGTVGLAADRLDRGAVLVELNEDYVELAAKRIRGDSPMFAEVEVMVA